MPSQIEQCSSTTTKESQSADEKSPGTLPPKARTVATYLTDRVKQEGQIYVKSRFIAEDIELSAKEIGAAMRQLQENADRLTVEQWAYTNGTTWLISSGNDG